MNGVANQQISGVSPVTPWPRRIYRTAEAFWADSKDLHYAYIVYRTLRGDHERIFKPTAVFYVGRSPAAYLKTLTTDRIPEDDVRDWQRFLWNQAVVPMLIVKSRTQVHVYTAYTRPQERDATERIEPILEDTTDTLALDQLYTAIEAGTIYEAYPLAFQRSQAVDHYLLKNLTASAHDLAQTQPGGLTQDNLEFAHTFLTRLLFVCYLIERGMIKGTHFSQTNLQKLRPASENAEEYFLRHLFNDLNTYAKKRDALCSVFGHVKTVFNGSLFPESITREKDRYNDAFIRKLNDFLQGHDVANKQLMLPFSFYDFSVIPIETISAVYEEFLGAEGKIRESSGNGDSQRSSGAYYTPLHLAELTVDIALESVNKPVHDLKVLDPACGSGVFLVSLFGRMADSLRRLENRIQKGRCINWARKLLPKLSQLYGIDISRTACHITCFSLYLALLEQLEPMDVEYLHKHKEKLPPLLVDGSVDSYNTVHHGNFFDPQVSLGTRSFDIVIGNPPWVSRGNQEDKYFLSWSNQDPHTYGPNKQIAHGFMWKTPEYLSDSGVACLLLPAAVIFNTVTNQFQKRWLKSVTVERIVNLSDLRFVLFPGPVHPCVALRFRSSPSKIESFICYETPKTDARSQQRGPIYIRDEDVTHFRLKDILQAAVNGNAPAIWKSRFWGTWRDVRLLSRLADLPKLSDLTGKPRQRGKRWAKGIGIEIGNQKYSGWWDDRSLYIKNTDELSLVITPQDCQTVRDAGIPSKAERPRKKGLFEGPKVLVSQGSKDMKVAFCNFLVLFQNSLYAIASKARDANLLRFLSAVIKSDLAQYFLFHTSANWGIEREKVVFHELLSLPFFLPPDAPDQKKAEDIIAEAANAIKDFEARIRQTGWIGYEDRRKNEADRVSREVLEPLVREYYDIDKYEKMLIEDTLQFAAKSFHPRQNTPDVPTLRTPTTKDAETYTQTLCEMLNNFGRDTNFRVQGDVVMATPYSIVNLRLDSGATRTVVVSDPGKLKAIFERMQPLLEHQQGRFVFCRSLKVFDGDDLYILKPMQMRFWSRTAALNDADEIAGAMLQHRRPR